uniref:Single domain-containing protein n=1 Tax=Amblyomma maculatum TaxID=34609 RepID=G3MPS5_AMBMU
MMQLMVLSFAVLLHSMGATHAEVFNSTGSLVFVNGTCWYNGLKIDDDTYQSFKKPCSQLWCSASKGYLTFYGCMRPLEKPYCGVPVDQVYPKCCSYTRTC